MYFFPDGREAKKIKFEGEKKKRFFFLSLSSLAECVKKSLKKMMTFMRQTRGNEASWLPKSLDRSKEKKW